MAASPTTQAVVLFYKNAKLKKNNKCGLCCQCVTPIVLVCLMLSFFTTGSVQTQLKLSPVLPVSTYLNNGKHYQLLYTPSSNQDAQQIIEGIFAVDIFKMQSVAFGFDTETQMEEYYNTNHSQVWSAVVFHSNFSLPSPSSQGNLQYTLRFPADSVPQAKAKSSNFDSGASYAGSGFLSLQNAINSVISNILLRNNNSNSNATVLVSENYGGFPDPTDSQKVSQDSIRVGLIRPAGICPHNTLYSLPFIISKLARHNLISCIGGVWVTVALVVTIYVLATEIVSEKEIKLKEGMKMMGLRESVYWITWFLTTTVVYALPLVLIVVIMCSSAIYQHSAFGLVLLFYLLFTWSLITLCFLITTFISKARIAGLITCILIIIFGILGPFAESTDSIGLGVKQFASLLSPIAFQMGHAVICYLENNGPGIHYYNISTQVENLPSFYSTLLLLAFDIVLYALLTWYITNVFPGDFGVPQPFYFPFLPSYWKCSFCSSSSDDSFSNMPLKAADNQHTHKYGTSSEFEEVVTDRTPTVAIKDLRKEFDTTQGTFVAVHGLNLDMYEDQVLSLLGHNGAGKTTLLSMLNGLITPTQGDAFIYGRSIKNEMSKIRTILGVCPQHDILWPQLTVYEHLYIFAGIKGVPFRQLSTAARDMCNELRLGEKLHKASSTLSGGQKRRLSVGLSMIGDSKIVFLDEPTSGLDPHSRRAIWQLVKDNKAGRVIVLTTHFMDEADYLGDRIAIMSKGHLRCVGSSLFLKTKFGVGYTATLVRTPQCQESEVTQFIKEFVPQAVLLSNSGNELSFRFPREDVGNFADLFTSLDQHRSSLGIESYGISLTTLEEVFLRIAFEGDGTAAASSHDNHDEVGFKGKEKETDHSYQNSNSSKNEMSFMDVSGTASSFFQQLHALLLKRWWMTRRDKKVFLFQFLLPLALVITGVALRTGLAETPGNNNILDTLLLDQSIYGDYSRTFVPYSIITGDQNATRDFLSQYMPCSFKDVGNTDELTQYLRATSSNASAGFLFNEINITNNNYDLSLLYNQSYVHSLPIFNNLMHQAIARRILNNDNIQILISTHPLRAFSTIDVSNVYLDLILLVMVVLAFATLVATFAVHLIKERETKAKESQLVNGATKMSYWCSFFIWDFLLCLVTVLLCTVILVATNWKLFGKENFGPLLFMLLLFVLTSLPMVYVLSFLFRKHAVAHGTVAAIFFFPAVMFIIAYIPVALTAGVTATNIVDTVFCCLSPSYSLAHSFFVFLDFLSLRTTYRSQDLFYWHLLGLPALSLTCYLVFFTFLLIFIEGRREFLGMLKKCGRSFSSPFVPQTLDGEDEDVATERQRIYAKLQNGTAQQESVVMCNLRKEWGDKNVAVQSLTLGIASGQCFGLLGANGAGKTTTLSILSGEFPPTSGTAVLNGHNLDTELSAVRSSVGFCPQFDALFDNMTGREHLLLYCRLKGIPVHQRQTVVEGFIARMNLGDYADKLTRGYSGGNKRKLSFVIALIGNPPVMFIDEPSTGMDPVSKRFMWNVILAASRDRSIILTTHSMEECDALCSRIGIMKKGQLMCLGSAQHLKSRFGSGYNIEIKIAASAMTNGNDQVNEFVHQSFPSAHLLEKHGSLLKYEISKKNCTLSHIFRLLEDNKQHLQIEDYSVSQTTLEQIFLRMNKEVAEYEDKEMDEGEKVDDAFVA